MIASGVRLDVRSDIDRVVAEFRAETLNVNQATYRALNRAVDKAATETSREIRKVYNVRDAAVKRAMKKLRASSGRLWATLMIEGARIALIEFDARWKRGQKGGASVRIKVAGGRKIVPGAFIGTNRHSGYTGVFRRVGPARYPIRNLRSVSLPQAFSNKVVIEAVQRMAQEAFEKNFEQQIRYLGSVADG